MSSKDYQAIVVLLPGDFKGCIPRLSSPHVAVREGILEGGRHVYISYASRTGVLDRSFVRNVIDSYGVDFFRDLETIRALHTSCSAGGQLAFRDEDASLGMIFLGPDNLY